MNKRRRLLQGISTLGVAGAAWQKPVVQATMLPAHAGTSVLEYFVTDLVADASQESPWYEDVLDAVVPSALAQTQGPTPSALCVMVSGAMAQVTGRNRRNLVEFGGTMPTDGSTQELGLQDQGVGCDYSGTPGQSPNVRIVDYVFGDPEICLEFTGIDSNPVLVKVPLGPCRNFVPLNECN